MTFDSFERINGIFTCLAFIGCCLAGLGLLHWAFFEEDDGTY